MLELFGQSPVCYTWLYFLFFDCFAVLLHTKPQTFSWPSEPWSAHGISEKKCTLRLWYSKPHDTCATDRYAPSIDWIRQVLGPWPNSTLTVISFVCIVACLRYLLQCLEKLVSPSFHLFRWLKGSARDLRGSDGHLNVWSRERRSLFGSCQMPWKKLGAIQPNRNQQQ